MSASKLPPPSVNPAHRWRCPACSRLYRHPWLLAVHLVAADTDPDRPGHGMAELDAWTTVATLAPAEGVTHLAAAG